MNGRPANGVETLGHVLAVGGTPAAASHRIRPRLDPLIEGAALDLDGQAGTLSAEQSGHGAAVGAPNEDRVRKLGQCGAQLLNLDAQLRVFLLVGDVDEVGQRARESELSDEVVQLLNVLATPVEIDADEGALGALGDVDGHTLTRADGAPGDDHRDGLLQARSNLEKTLTSHGWREHLA